MQVFPKVLRSEAIARFQDCDPYGHLYNAKYIDYFMNAREDQVLEAYGLNIYELGKTDGLGWVVGQNQIAYLQPVHIMEKVAITSSIVEVSPRAMTVEFQMLDAVSDRLKAFMWSRFVHFNLLRRESTTHSDKLMDMFGKVLCPVVGSTFEERLRELRSAQQVS